MVFVLCDEIDVSWLILEGMKRTTPCIGLRFYNSDYTQHFV